MDTKRALRSCINSSQHLIDSYLNDLSDADLLVRAIPNTNHIAWQLGHLIHGEHAMVDAARPGCMPKLPEGFSRQHDKKTAGSDNLADFLTKDEYLRLFKQQRAGTLALLEAMSDSDLDVEMPEPFRKFLKTVGDMFVFQGTHWVMHAGQWALVRRKLGHPPLF